MKIHGTAKGAALSTKDFGVAFGGAVADDCQNEGTNQDYMQKPPSGGGAGNAQRYGCKMESGSVFIGNTYNTTKVFLRKEAGTGSTDFNVSIYRDGTTDPVHTFEIKNSDNITTSIVEYSFTGGGDYTIVADDIIAVNWENESKKLYVYVYNSAVSNLPQMRYNQWDDANRTTWTAFTGASFRFCLS